jgi:hypothetical protein
VAGSRGSNLVLSGGRGARSDLKVVSWRLLLLLFRPSNRRVRLTVHCDAQFEARGAPVFRWSGPHGGAKRSRDATIPSPRAALS